MNTIIPRWEWRCFAPSLAALAAALRLPADAAAIDSDEVYILDLGGGASDNIKVRGGALDVKRLRQTEADGLEQWEPVLKAAFPLTRRDAAAIFRDRPSLREGCALAEFLAQVARQSGLRAVPVHKTRRTGVFAGCLAEHARLAVEGIALETVALEAEDPGRLRAALAALGLDSRANTSYPLGLKRALGLASATD